MFRFAKNRLFSNSSSIEYDGAQESRTENDDLAKASRLHQRNKMRRKYDARERSFKL